jgi:sarcosine oxidase subunit beta
VDDVRVLERDQPASGATGRSAGFVTPYQFLGTGIHANVTRYCTDFFEELATVSDSLDLHFREALTLARREHAVTSVRRLHEETEWPSELLTGDALSTRLPPLSTEGIEAAVAFENGMFLDPHSATTSLLDVARDNGATLSLETVEAIEKTGGVFQVDTDEGGYEATDVVIATGAWSKQLTAPLEVTLPLKPRISQIAMLRTAETIELPLVNDPDLDLYYRTEVDGDVLVGGGVDKEEYDVVGFSGQATESFLTEISQKAGTIVPELADARITSSWAGLCSATPDRHPYIGETAIPGLYLSCGFNGEGVMYSPMAGRIVSDLITGAPSPMDRAPYRPGRFAGDADFEIKSALEW